MLVEQISNKEDPERPLRMDFNIFQGVPFLAFLSYCENCNVFSFKNSQ